MTDFIIKKLPYDLSSNAVLTFIGKYLKSLIDSAVPIRAGIANSNVLKSYIALLSLGKNDFGAIENFRHNDFFRRALGLTFNCRCKKQGIASAMPSAALSG